MSTMSLSAELFRELSYLADDEGCMRSLVAYARRLVARRREEDEAREGMAVAEEGVAYRPLTREEMAAEVEEMCREVKLIREGKLEGRPAEELLYEL